MHVEAWDTVFVRARRVDVHPLVREPAGYARWWPGVRTEVRGDSVGLALRPPGRRGHRERLVVRRSEERPAKGVRLAVAGDLHGEVEWYYLDEPTGVTVHHLVKGDVAGRGWRRWLAGHRAAVRVGLHALKDRLEGDREPGAEPDPGLVADQRRALAAFRAEVAAARRRTVAG